jgi:hypothetical protein
MKCPFSLRIATPSEVPPIQVSKLLQVQTLLETQEVQALFEALGTFHIFLAGSVTNSGEGYISHTEFIEKYAEYLQTLKSGQSPDDSLYRVYFSSVFTVTPDLLYTSQFSDGRQLIRPSKPVVQLQLHRMDYSPVDGKFRPMILGIDSISWGLQFSYPQLYQNPVTKQPENVVESEAFPNTALFRSLQRWIRHHTIPTPFIVEGKQQNVPIRLGKECLSWINSHPELIKKGLKVKEAVTKYAP